MSWMLLESVLQVILSSSMLLDSRDLLSVVSVLVAIAVVAQAANPHAAIVSAW